MMNAIKILALIIMISKNVNCMFFNELQNLYTASAEGQGGKGSCPGSRDIGDPVLSIGLILIKILVILE